MPKRFSFKPICWLLLLGLLAQSGATRLLAQDCCVGRNQHSWGRFSPGAWRKTRLSTETFDAAGNATHSSVTETISTLVATDESRYTLRVESTTEVAGRRISSPIETVAHRFDGTRPGQTVQISAKQPDKIMIGDTEIEGQVQQLVISDAACKTTTRIFVCEKLPPYILARTTVSQDKLTSAITESTLEVVALDMPHRVVDQLRNTTHTRLAQKHARGSSQTLAVNSHEVPGGLVAYTAKEIDAEGKAIRHSTMELVDFGVVVQEEAPQRPRIIRRGRARVQARRERRGSAE